LTWANAELVAGSKIDSIPVVQRQLTNLESVTRRHVSCLRNIDTVLSQGHSDLSHVELLLVRLCGHVSREIEGLALIGHHSVPALSCTVARRDLKFNLINVEEVAGDLSVPQFIHASLQIPLSILNVLELPFEVTYPIRLVTLDALKVLHVFTL